MRYLLMSVFWVANLVSGSLHAQPLPGYIPYMAGGKWGYCDSNKRLLIAPQWDEAFFFIHGKAITRLGDSYCLIDTIGRYIIPPERHWNGDIRKSIVYSTLNSRDSNGRWGFIDTANKLIIPFLYDAPSTKYPQMELSQRFMTFGTSGMAYYIAGRQAKMGLIDGFGRVLIPFEYDELSDANQLHNYHPDSPLVYLYASKGGRHGMIDTADRVVIPFAWNGMKRIGNTKYIVVSSNAGKGLIDIENGRIVVPASYDEVAAPGHFDDNSRLKGFELTKNGKKGWASLATGSIIEPAWDKVEDYYGDGSYAVGNYIEGLKLRMGVVNSDGKVLVPCEYDYVTKAGDTMTGYRIVFENDNEDTLLVSEDTYRQYIINGNKVKRGKGGTYRSEHSNLYRPVRGNFCGTSSSRHSFEESRYIWKGGAKLNYFKKDSLEYIVKNQLADTLAYVVETVRNRVGQPPSFAVVDTNLNYIVPPQSRYELAEGSLKRGALIAKEHGLYGLVNVKLNEVLLPFQELRIKNYCRWNGRWYALAIDTIRAWDLESYNRYLSGSEYVSVDRGPEIILNDAGKASMKGGVYRVAYTTDTNGKRNNYWLTGHVMMRDSSGKRALADVNGHLLFPALSFKYTQLESAWNGLFYHECPGCATDYRVVVDRNDKDIFGGRLSASYESLVSEGYGKVYYANGNTQSLSLPLTELNVMDRESGKKFKVYKDRHGTVYFQ